ncbi:NAD-binding protein [Streptomyces olivochromogenes]|uniref:NAD-binding protein n=1 Tax=Streptomyces olivochromogenes TaxID=1963 RepID=UPI0036C424D5
MLDGASGRSAATNEKFPNHVLTGRYAAGFTNTLMTKDVQLYLRAVEEEDRSAPIGAAAGALWESFAAAEPGADFTRVSPYIDYIDGA